MSISSCCLKGTEWKGEPVGVEETISGLSTYVSVSDTNTSSRTAILVIHDLFGWKFPNVRLLADHYAEELQATAYVPDFFGGQILDWEVILGGDFSKLDLPNFMQTNNRHAREPEIVKFARYLRSKYTKVCAVGFCYGGWAVMRLGAQEHQPALVDCIVAAHPSFLTEKDVDEVAVPVHMLAPEEDQMYTAELKRHTFDSLLNRKVPFDYQHFPGVEHGCFIRGDLRKPGEQDAMLQGRKAAVAWFARHTRHEQ